MIRFKHLREKIETNSLRDEQSPAPMLVLQRRGIRIFPDGRKVALYTNQKYNLTFTIPYGGPQTTPIMGFPNV